MKIEHETTAEDAFGIVQVRLQLMPHEVVHEVGCDDEALQHLPLVLLSHAW